MDSRRSLCLLVVLALWLEVTGFPCPASAASSLAPGVKAATIHRDDGKGQPGEPVTQVQPADRTLHFRVEMDRHHDDEVEAKWVFVSVDTSAGKDTQFGESTLRGKGYTKISGVLRGEADWPVGRYRVDLFLNGKLTQSIDYACAAPTPPSSQPSASPK